MKKIIFLLIFFLLLTWCSKKETVQNIQNTTNWEIIQTNWENLDKKDTTQKTNLTWNKNVDEVIKIMDELLQ